MAQQRHNLASADGRQRGHLREVGAEDEPRQSDVAAELYQTRLRRGIELDHAAGELRIHYEQLLAIEEGRFDDLPGPAYVIGFLRSYAAYLDLDGDEMVRRFKAETADFDARQDLAFPSPHDEGRVPTAAIIVLGLALVGAAYAGWYYVSNVDRVAIERIPEVPERLAAELPPESESPLIDDIVASVPEPVVAVTDEPAAGHEARAAIAPADPPAAAEAPEVSEPAVVEPEPEPEPVFEPESEPESEIVAAVTDEPALAESAAVEPAAPEPVESPVADVATAAVAEPAEAQVQAIEPEPVEPEPMELEPVEPVVIEVEAAEPEAAEPEIAEPEVAAPEAVASETAAPAIEKTALAEPAVPEPQQPEPQQTASVVPESPAPVVESTDYAPREFGRANSGSTIRLRARLESWVQVTGADNELLLTRILRPGDIYHVPDRPGLVLMTGNAGGLEVLVGDVVAPALGPVGEIQRRVALDPERLLAGTAID